MPHLTIDSGRLEAQLELMREVDTVGILGVICWCVRSWLLAERRA